jgi:hypothetical protein
MANKDSQTFFLSIQRRGVTTPFLIFVFPFIQLITTRESGFLAIILAYMAKNPYFCKNTLSI